jgi:hypothetical protein
MSLFTDSLNKEVCALCGKTVSANHGHFVRVVVGMTSEGDAGEAIYGYEFHCMDCDPIDLNEEQPQSPGGDN